MKRKESWEYTPKNTRDVCHQWASRKKESAEYGTVSFSNGVIYSYGWYPMAKWYDSPTGIPFVIMTSNTYSNSTAQHLSHVRSAIPNEVQIFYTDRSVEFSFTYRRGAPDLSLKSVELSILDRMKKFYNDTFEKKAYRGQYHCLTPEQRLESSKNTYSKAQLFTKLAGLDWNQDFDVYVLNEHDVKTAWNIARPVIEAQEERRKIKEKKELEIKEAHDRAVAKYCKDSFEMACDWIRTRNKILRLGNDYVDIPEDDEYFKLTGIKSICQRVDTSMRIQGNEVVTNMGARVPLDDAKKLWELIKRGHNVRGVQCGLYTVLSMNGELIIGCHHISRRVIDFFVEYYNW